MKNYICVCYAQNISNITHRLHPTFHCLHSIRPHFVLHILRHDFDIFALYLAFPIDGQEIVRGERGDKKRINFR